MVNRLTMKKDLLQAIELAIAGQWDRAHTIVQQADTDATAAWIHAVLHKIEGDHNNSRYWYSRAGKLSHTSSAPKSELAEIKKTLTD